MTYQEMLTRRVTFVLAIMFTTVALIMAIGIASVPYARGERAGATLAIGAAAAGFWLVYVLQRLTARR